MNRYMPLILALALLVLLAACVQPVAEPKMTAPAKIEAAPAPVPAPAPVEVVPVNPYDVKPAPLTVSQCGQCHTSYFNAIKENGGRHKFDCQDCHQVFHAYNPNKNNWAQIMPQCSSCHNLPHGPKQTECLACHSNPHTPLNLVLSDRLTKNCADCHASPAAQVKEFPSKHTLVECSSCHHTKHGYIPSCFECHKGHYENEPLETCTTCHPVHKPLQIVFKGDVELKNCAGCHSGVYAVWSGSKSKHAAVSCVSCHTSHGMIPSCSNCHGDAPHNASLHAKFPNCLTCHLDPHDPPVKTE